MNSPGYRNRTATLRRRVVTVPLFLVAAAFVTVIFPFLVTVAIVLDLLCRRRFPNSRLVLAAVAYLWAEVVGIAMLTFIWFATLGRDEARVKLTYWLQQRWTSTLFAVICKVFSLKIEAEGAEKVDSGPFLLLVRHVSLFDIFLPPVLVTRQRGLKLRYVLKRELLIDPCLDIAGNRLANYFVDRDSDLAVEEVAGVGQLASQLEVGEGVAIYPEGTRFSDDRLKRARDFLRRNAPELADLAGSFQSVLPPRPGGFLALLAAAPQADVVICGHRGLEGLRTVSSIRRQRFQNRLVTVRFQRFERSEIPNNPVEQTRWLYERWLDLDGWSSPSSDVAAHLEARGSTVEGTTKRL